LNLPEREFAAALAERRLLNGSTHRKPSREPFRTTDVLAARFGVRYQGALHMFASPVAPPPILPPRDIVRFLRLITSPACRGDKRVPLSVIAAMCGVSRFALYNC
jgi:hypothetical protein